MARDLSKLSDDELSRIAFQAPKKSVSDYSDDELAKIAGVDNTDWSKTARDLVQTNVDALPMYGGAMGSMFGPIGTGMGTAAGSSLKNTINSVSDLMSGKRSLSDELRLPTRDEVASVANDTVKSFNEGVVSDMGGQIIGKAVQAAAPLVSKAADKISQGASSGAERMAARALGAERGTIKKLGQDKVQELGRYALDEGLLSPFANTDDLISRNAAKQAQGAQMMDEVYSKIDDAGASTFNPLNVAAKVDEQIGGFYRSPINRGEVNQLENTLESILMRGESNLPIKEAQALKQELGKVANWKNNLNITDKERMAREAYGIVSSSIDEAVETGANAIGTDGLLETLKSGKSLYGASKGAEQLLENKLAREQGNKMMGLTDWGLLSGGGAATLATGGAAAVPTVAALGAKKYAEKYGAQQSALVLDKISQSLMKSPEMAQLAQKSPSVFQSFVLKMAQNLEPAAEQVPAMAEGRKEPSAKTDKKEILKKTEGSQYAQILQNAASRGDEAFNAAHYILSQRDPNYRKQLGEGL